MIPVSHRPAFEHATRLKELVSILFSGKVPKIFPSKRLNAWFPKMLDFIAPQPNSFGIWIS
jgi:hypothetical protein